MVILQQPDSFCFSSALKDLIIRTEENIEVSFSIRGGEPFLTESYSPDAENTIHVRELGKLFLPHIPKASLRETFVIQITGTSGATASITSTVLYGLCEINATASDFLNDSFLTLLHGEKITFPEQKEYLSPVVTENTTVDIQACRLSGAAESKTQTVNSLNRAVTPDVSPAIFDAPETLAYYTVTAGVRMFTYYLRPPSATERVQFFFSIPLGWKRPLSLPG